MSEGRDRAGSKSAYQSLSVSSVGNQKTEFLGISYTSASSSVENLPSTPRLTNEIIVNSTEN